MLLVLLVATLGCYTSALSTNTNGSHSPLQLPIVIEKTIYISAVLETDPEQMYPTHLVVLRLRPLQASSPSSSADKGMNGKIKRKRKISSAYPEETDCRIADMHAPQQYVITPARYIPGNVPYDYFDIIRCEIPATIFRGKSSFADSSLQIALVSGSLNILVEFTVPVNKRSAGYMSTAMTMLDSRIKQNDRVNNRVVDPVVYLFVPCVVEFFSRDLVARVLEFLQHHILLGVSHIIMGFPYEQQSKNMDFLIQCLNSFIQSKHLTVISLIDATKTIPKLSTSRGVIKYRSISSLVFNNMFLYLAKGVADYIGIWNINSFFIPSGAQTLPSVIYSHRFKHGLPGFGDGSAHPNCQLSVSTKLLFDGHKVHAGAGEIDASWIGNFYPKEVVEFWRSSSVPFSAIIATDTIFRIGISGWGEACRLPIEWTRCSRTAEYNEINFTDRYNFCTGVDKGLYRRKEMAIKTRRFHDFDFEVTATDVRSINSMTEGSLVRFIARPREADTLSHIVKNEYKIRFFDRVLAELWNRGVEVFNSLPIDESDNLLVNRMKEQWQPLVHQKFPSGNIRGIGSLPSPVIDKNRGQDSGNVVTFPTRSNDELTVLPQYSDDNTEFFYGAMIERKAGSLDLHMTVFLVCPSMAKTTRHVEGLENTQKHKWKKYILANRRPKYDLSGIRKQKYYCRIKNAADDAQQQYVVPAHFIPNRLTPDANANGNVDIMRCPMQDTANAYANLAGGDENVVVEILRDKELKHLISFKVPWRSRQTGYMMDNPPGATSLNAWIARDELLSANKHTQSTSSSKVTTASDELTRRHDLYMCVPGMESPFDRRILPLYAEFLEHHFQLGVKHIFLAATYTWGGENMKNLLGAFRSYLDDGMLSVTSNAVGIGASDYTYSFNGVALARDTVKVIFTNMCLYQAKGMADYVGIWDFDEFFIPRLPHNSIMDVVRHLDTMATERRDFGNFSKDKLAQFARSWTGAPGFADGDGHRACYILLDSETITSAPEDKRDAVWIGERFAHGSHKSRMSFQKPIFPTDRIWQASLHVGGACQLPPEWLHCKNTSVAVNDFDYNTSPEFCYLDNGGLEQTSGVTVRNKKGFLQTFSPYHALNEPVREHDARRASIKNDAIIYHIQAHREYLKTDGALSHLLQQTNEYTARFFDSVYAGLVKRGIAVLQELPDLHPEVDNLSKLNWLRLSQTHQAISALDEDTATNSGLQSAKLPAFSVDSSEFAFSSVIERSSHSEDLFVTTFLLSHAMMSTHQANHMSVEPSQHKKWRTFYSIARETKYSEEGVRIMDESFTCKIRNGIYHRFPVYIAPVELIPNRLTPDSNANRRLDILRCKMKRTDLAHSELAGSSESALIEILKGQKCLFRFEIPWSSRRIGHMMETNGTSLLNPWIGSKLTIANERDDLHMCVPGMESPPDKEMLPLYAEFVQHHLALGVKHIHIGTMFSWDSQAMHDVLQILGSFIDEGRVSVTTQTDGYNMLYSTRGIVWDRDDSKIFFVNMCLYFAKGMADYVGIWDFDEFFIPRKPFKNIMDIVHSIEADDKADMERSLMDLKKLSVDKAKQKYKSGPGLAEGDGHPFCYILLSSESVHNHPEERTFNVNMPWIGQRYDHIPEKKSSHAFKKSILPTDKIFYAGLHMAGACKLPFPWNGCDQNENSEFCISSRPRDYYGLSYTETDKKQVDFSFYQVFNGVVMDKDTKQIRTDSQGLIYHFQFHRIGMLASLLAAKSDEKNEYATRFFPAVMKELGRRGVTLIQNFPALTRRGNSELFGPKWTRSSTFFTEERV